MIASFALFLLALARISIDFGKFKAKDDDAFKKEVPEHYAAVFFWVGAALLFVSILSFIASNTENYFLMVGASVASAISLILVLGLGVSNEFI